MMGHLQIVIVLTPHWVVWSYGLLKCVCCWLFQMDTDWGLWWTWVHKHFHRRQFWMVQFAMKFEQSLTFRLITICTKTKKRKAFVWPDSYYHHHHHGQNVHPEFQCILPNACIWLLIWRLISTGKWLGPVPFFYIFKLHYFNNFVYILADCK